MKALAASLAISQIGYAFLGIGLLLLMVSLILLWVGAYYELVKSEREKLLL